MADNDNSFEGYPDQETVNNEWTAALETRPNIDGWAVFATQPNYPTPFEDFGGNFFWFKNRREFLLLLKSYPMFFQSVVETTQERQLFDRIQSKIRDTVYNLEHDHISENDAREELNKILGEVEIEISWWGPVKSLDKNRHPLIATLRKRFKVDSTCFMSEEFNKFEDFLYYLGSVEDGPELLI